MEYVLILSVVLDKLNKDIYNVRKSRDLSGSANAHAWLTSAHLQDHVVSALVELRDNIDKNTTNDGDTTDQNGNFKFIIHKIRY